MSEQSHRADPRILNRRTLQRDHGRLVSLLRPGMSVLDVGCGTGSITAGIAAMTGPEGQVVGLDRDATLVALAREEHHGVPNLRFETGDILSVFFEDLFDIVSAARCLQWIGRPADAVVNLKNAAKPGGRVVALDYNHEDNSWEPSPPSEFRRFYAAFLEWRGANQWDNRMADRLPELFLSARMTAVQAHCDDEIARLGEDDFPEAARLWTHVIQTIGPQLVAGGFIDERVCRLAEESYREWGRSGLRQQTLCLRTVVGLVPGGA